MLALMLTAISDGSCQNWDSVHNRFAVNLRVNFERRGISVRHTVVCCEWMICPILYKHIGQMSDHRC